LLAVLVLLLVLPGQASAQILPWRRPRVFNLSVQVRPAPVFYGGCSGFAGGYGAPQLAGYGYGAPQLAGYGYGAPQLAGYGYGAPQLAGYGYGGPDAGYGPGTIPRLGGYEYEGLAPAAFSYRPPRFNGGFQPGYFPSSQFAAGGSFGRY
jgi:hypothetical protein